MPSEWMNEWEENYCACGKRLDSEGRCPVCDADVDDLEEEDEDA